jgi:class 3 adenylate cyclase
MLCDSCGTANPGSAKFCAECGRPLSSRCVECRTEIPGGAKFCLECGAPAGEPATGPVAGSASASDDDAGRSGPARTPEGERKQVTVLFVDVQGSMRLAGAMDPEAWSEIMQGFFGVLTEGIEHFGGFVDKFTGDGIMALFGAPVAREDHAQRACHAALHLGDELARYAAGLELGDGGSFSTRMGLNSGEVVVGTIGDDQRMEYTAIGHTVGLAQRMESVAEPDTCFLSAATANLVEGFFELDDRGEVAVKGIDAPLRAFRLDGIGVSQSRFEVSQSRGLSRFVGRGSDLRSLEEALGQAAGGNGQVVGVVAKAGTGKSRLCFEFLEQCRAEGLRVFEARAVAHGRHVPYLPILEVFRAYFEITIELDPAEARRQVGDRLLALGDDLADVLLVVFDFLGIGDPDVPPPALDPTVRQRQLMGVMSLIVRSFNDTRPAVTLIEDLQWLDSASEEFLSHMVDARAGTRSLLLLNFRPEYRADWMAKSWYRQIPLAPLDRASVAEVLADLLGDDSSIAGLTDPVYSRADGNPFFVEEVARNLIETGHLEGSRGNYRLVTPIESLEVPDTVNAVLAARIDRLSERDKRLLQVASVIGKDFPESLLDAVAELEPTELAASLTALGQAEFIRELSLYPAVEYTFEHPLTQEVAAGSLLKDRRQDLHSRIATAIELHGAGSIDERAALLAMHYQQAAEPLPAARWHKRAAEWVARSDYIAAGHHWRAICELLHDQPTDTETADLGFAACVQLLIGSLYFELGPEERTTVYEDGRRYAEAIGDPRTKFMLGFAHARSVLGGGDVAGNMTYTAQNYRAVQTDPDSVIRAHTRMMTVDALIWATQLREAKAAADGWLAEFHEPLPPEDLVLGFSPHAIVWFWRGYALAWGGRLTAAHHDFVNSLRAGEQDETPPTVHWTEFYWTEGCYLAGDATQASVHATRVVELSSAMGDPPVQVAYAHMAAALVHLTAGRGADAIEPARAALATHRQVEVHLAAVSSTLLAEALLQSGDFDAARTAAEEAIVLGRQYLRANYEAIAHGVLARALLRRSGSEAVGPAAAELAAAAALIEAGDIGALEPALYEWQAEHAGVAGNQAARIELIERARQGYDAIGASQHATRITTT